MKWLFLGFGIGFMVMSFFATNKVVEIWVAGMTFMGIGQIMHKIDNIKTK